MISALLASGRFVPGEHGLSEEDLSCWEKLWRFCTEYQIRAGGPPGLELVRSKFPDYLFVPGVDINWAADQLHDASYGRHVRREMGTALRALGDNDMLTVNETLRALAEPRRQHKLEGLDAFDPRNAMVPAAKIGIPVPFPSLAASIECIGMMEMVVLAAYTGHGKSQMLPYYAAFAAEHGYHVTYLSAEMPAEAINRRIHRCHARGDRGLQARLRDHDQNERMAALEEIKARIPGSITTIDRSMVRMMTPQTVEDATHDKHIVFIDHIGLLSTNEGVRAIDDWRAMAKISNILREVNQATRTAIFSAAQVGKDGDTAGATPPKLSTIAGSIAIAQDAEIVITQKKPAQNMLSHQLGKYREGFLARWYTEFDPAQGNYTEITKEDAKARKSAEEDRNIDV